MRVNFELGYAQCPPSIIHWQFACRTPPVLPIDPIHMYTAHLLKESGEYHVYDWIVVTFDQEESGLPWRDMCTTPPVLPREEL